jgi:hypothetical protein
MKPPRAKSDGNVLCRRDLVKAVAVAAAGGLTGPFRATPAAAQGSRIEAQEHWASKGPLKLYLYRKRQIAGGSVTKPCFSWCTARRFRAGAATTSSCQGAQVIRPWITSPDLATTFGPWIMRAMGSPARTSGHSGIQTGVEDLKAALALVEQVTGKASVYMFGESSGLSAPAPSPWRSLNAWSGSFCTPYIHRRECP